MTQFVGEDSLFQHLQKQAWASYTYEEAVVIRVSSTIHVITFFRNQLSEKVVKLIKVLLFLQNVYYVTSTHF